MLPPDEDELILKVVRDAGGMVAASQPAIASQILVDLIAMATSHQVLVSSIHKKPWLDQQYVEIRKSTQETAARPQ